MFRLVTRTLNDHGPIIYSSLAAMIVIAIPVWAETTDSQVTVHPSSVEPAETVIDEKAPLLDSATRDEGPQSFCVEEPSEPLPSDACYECVAEIREGCPPTIECGVARESGKSFCTITIGGGEIKCETSGPSCTSV